jgi:uncharacterized protein YceK
MEGGISQQVPCAGGQAGTDAEAVMDEREPEGTTDVDGMAVRVMDKTQVYAGYFLFLPFSSIMATVSLPFRFFM